VERFDRAQRLFPEASDVEFVYWQPEPSAGEHAGYEVSVYEVK
jgi:hypothetical protein